MQIRGPRIPAVGRTRSTIQSTLEHDGNVQVHRCSATYMRCTRLLLLSVGILLLLAATASTVGTTATSNITRTTISHTIGWTTNTG